MDYGHALVDFLGRKEYHNYWKGMIPDDLPVFSIPNIILRIVMYLK